MATQAELQAAKSVVRTLLLRLLGPDLSGVNAFGVSWDQASGQRVVRVDFDPSVPPDVRKQVPATVGNVEVRVEQSPVAEFEWGKRL